jgi:hypothetical protein
MGTGGAANVVVEDLPLVERIIGAPSSQAMLDLVFAHPRLLSQDRVAVLEAALLFLAPDNTRRLRSGLETLQQVQASLLQQPSRYPIGSGPIEQIWYRVQEGEISIGDGERLAARAEIGRELSPIYVQVLCRFAVHSAAEVNWRAILQLGLLLLAASRAAPASREGQYAKERIAIDFLDIASGSLVQVPDGRLYRRALEVGARSLGWPSASGNRYFRGAMLHRLGALHLDPYTAGRSNQQYEEQHRRWLQRLWEEYADELVNVPPEELQMPDPVDALYLADRYLQEAVDLNEGHAKGLSLKARVQCLAFLESLGQDVSKTELIGLCYQALRFLDQEEGQQQRASVMATLSRHNQSP